MPRQARIPRKCPMSHTGAHLWTKIDREPTRQKGTEQPGLWLWSCAACGAVKLAADSADQGGTG